MTKKFINKTVTFVVVLVVLLCQTVAAYASTRVCVGGMPFGAKIYTDGAIVSQIGEIEVSGQVVSPGESAGIMIKDIITEVNGKKVTSALDVSRAIAESAGNPVSLKVVRGEERINLTITPVLSTDGTYRAGLWLKDTTAGVGTVTYIMPETGEFGALGHGICDSDTGRLLPLLRGTVTSVTINGIRRGLAGAPGEIKGSLGAEKTGVLTKNTANGVFGVMSLTGGMNETVEIGTREDICEGEAKIICTLNNDEKKEYGVVISALDRAKTGNKCFVVTVNDKELIEKTGGIVQGMSGSPIIQNGKLVGAVTHVFVNDPTRGYGIFIENMLAEAEKIK